MEVFTDLGQFSTIFAVAGTILFVLGFLLRARAKREAGSAVVSMLLMTIGAVLLLAAASKHIAKAFEDWGLFSDKMR